MCDSLLFSLSTAILYWKTGGAMVWVLIKQRGDNMTKIIIDCLRMFTHLHCLRDKGNLWHFSFCSHTILLLSFSTPICPDIYLNQFHFCNNMCDNDIRKEERSRIKIKDPHSINRDTAFLSDACNINILGNSSYLWFLLSRLDMIYC